MTVAAAAPHTTATAKKLTDAGLRVGRGMKPDGAGWQGEPGASTHKPYVILYPSSGTTDGDLGDPHEYLDYRVQATCVAATQDGAENVADLVQATLVGQRITVPGRSVYPFQLVDSVPASRDDQVAPPVHYAIVHLEARSGPA